MRDFVVKELINSDIKKEIEDVGYDKSYSHKACNKFNYKNIKIYNVTTAQANIIKQTALTVGADCATHRDCITGNAGVSDCILGGSLSQIKIIAEKLQKQPFGLKDLGNKLLINTVRTQHTTKLVGILNLTQNSFSDGGEYYEYEKAIKHLDEMIADGANIIDIGAESTKPGATPVSDQDQLERLLPVIKYAKGKNYTISIDTRSSQVAQQCLELGADIINDVSGFDYDLKLADIVAQYGAKVIIQHSKGIPENMQDNPQYGNLMDEIFLGLKTKIDFALSKGIKQENIIIDPGIGFGKTRNNNFEILRRIEEFKYLDCPIMLGLSRKSLLNMPEADNQTKDIYTTALNTLAIMRGVDYLRVHNVKMHKKLLDLVSEIIL